jgi:membrane protein YqaA with SNARE-associated domain
VTFGALGLFAIALLDSALIPMAGGPDAVLLLLAAQRPSWMLVYAAAATVGSTAGCVILYYISQRAGRAALSRFSERKQARVKDLIDRYDVLSVLVASLLPPPFPFKLFVVSAGVFRLSILRFTIAVAAGRAFRYTLEAYLAARYGERAKDLLAQYYPMIGIGLAVLIIIIFVGRNLLRKRTEAKRAEAGDQSLEAGD